jgi:tripartite-type tricarboxylate transporter receptor subunit TctC
MSGISRRAALVAGGLIAATGLARHAPAQRRWARPVRVVCGFPAGGLSDAFARAYSEHLSAALGTPFVVENRPGAGSILACEQVARAAPDGHTLLFTIQTAMVQNQALYRRLPYDPGRDFTYLAFMDAGRILFCLGRAVPAATVAEFVAWARGNRAALGTYAPGSYPHVVAVRLNAREGTDLTPVHYRGEAPMWQGLAAGDLQAAGGSYPAGLPLLQSGAARAVAVGGPTRLGRLPGVPTFAEQGFDDPVFRSRPWHCMVGPAGMDPGLREELSGLMMEAGRTPRLRALLDGFGIEVGASSWRDLEQVMRDEAPAWIAAVRELGVTLD